MVSRSRRSSAGRSAPKPIDRSVYLHWLQMPSSSHAFVNECFVGCAWTLRRSAVERSAGHNDMSRVENDRSDQALQRIKVRALLELVVRYSL